LPNTVGTSKRWPFPGRAIGWRSGCVDGLVGIWRVDDGKLLQRLEGRGGRAIERLA
jgi:hypothetical protein